MTQAELAQLDRKGYRATTDLLAHKVCRVYKESRALLDLRDQLAIQA